jgi:fatty-acid desaturase
MEIWMHKHTSHLLYGNEDDDDHNDPGDGFYWVLVGVLLYGDKTNF